MTKTEMVAFAMDLGYAIVIPLVILALAGKWLDHHYHTGKMFTLIGILLALIATIIWFMRKLKDFIK